MPVWFIVGFIAVSFLFPRFMSYTVHAPVLGFTFGGLAWTLGGFIGITSLSWASFLTCVVPAVMAFEVYFLSKLE